MAKVTAPLFSFGARGQLGQALVYFPWKGIHAVRTYVVPANPNSAAQQTHRARMTLAVSDWHDIGLDADDIVAWDRYAATLPRSMSGFNAFTKDHLNLQVGGDTPEMGFDGSLTDDADNTFSAIIKELGDATDVNLKWGTSPTSLINTEAGSETANTWDFTPSDNVAGQTLFGRFELEDGGGVIGYSGIFRLVMA